MSWYTIKHSCGHEERVQIYGTNVHGERDKKAAWMASRPCSECLLKAEEERLGISSELKGSEKQVAWARKIRAKMVGEVAALCAQADANLDKGGDPRYEAIRPCWAALRDDALSDLRGQESAAWYIDHKDDDTNRFVLQLVAKACTEAGYDPTKG